MQVRWTTDAADDLERIYHYIGERDPASARRVVELVINGVAALDQFPHRGRPGRVIQTRELVFSSLPFVAIYEVDASVTVLRILHAAQLWPPGRG